MIKHWRLRITVFSVVSDVNVSGNCVKIRLIKDESHLNDTYQNVILNAGISTNASLFKGTYSSELRSDEVKFPNQNLSILFPKYSFKPCIRIFKCYYMYELYKITNRLSQWILNQHNGRKNCPPNTLIK